ncbi:MAG: tRNA (adenosine(37)-N6)-dimethylallyltransferase MiaA [Prevotellaceae bacterium]|jgi:tRNA dimethylallyltransferase|nr:tRNA (adenosine(37)-N6)-dimethylallyltransferase MiaA [Prevotellaceae bacterium]
MTPHSSLRTLYVLLGATCAGKTDLSISLAKRLGCSIISSDSRQIYRELRIGVASPSDEQLVEVKHYFIGTRSVTEHYSAGQYELDAIEVIEKEIEKNGCALLVGGSMLYIDAVCKGIDDIPDIEPEMRANMKDFYKKEGIEGVRLMLKTLDPEHYAQVDLKNVKRMLHALEVCHTTGRPFSELRKNSVKKRSFNIVKIGLNKPRKELYSAINQRVIEMMKQGLEQEAYNLRDKSSLNALNTVGYKELFACFNGEYSLERAIELIQRNTRHYAKKQISWFNRDKNIQWFNTENQEDIIKIL